MKLVFATRNIGKLEEARRILGSGVTIFGAAEMRLPEVEETGDTFEQNARLKALAAVARTGLPSLGDDSGLQVDALHGRPGVRSARYGGPGLDDAGRRKLLLQELDAVPDGERGAVFVCVLVLALPEGREVVARGACRGAILHEERGDGGFGYDRLFLPDGQSGTFGELAADVKNTISHRAKALALLRTELE